LSLKPGVEVCVYVCVRRKARVFVDHMWGVCIVFQGWVSFVDVCATEQSRCDVCVCEIYVNSCTVFLVHE
jgi:hypothetical protein